MSSLGEYICKHRKAKNLSMRKLAELAHVSATEIHRLENGERKRPSPLVLKAIARALGESYSDIMKAAGYADSSPPSNVAARLAQINDLTEEEWEEVLDFVEYLRLKRQHKNNLGN